MGYNRGSRSITIESKGAELTTEVLAGFAIEALRRDGTKTAHFGRAFRLPNDAECIQIEWYPSDPTKIKGKSYPLTSYLRERKGCTGVYVLRSGTMPWSTEQTVFCIA